MSIYKHEIAALERMRAELSEQSNTFTEDDAALGDAINALQELPLLRATRRVWKAEQNIGMTRGFGDAYVNARIELRNALSELEREQERLLP